MLGNRRKWPFRGPQNTGLAEMRVAREEDRHAVVSLL
jgi:hypothetical protein